MQNELLAGTGIPFNPTSRSGGTSVYVLVCSTGRSRPICRPTMSDIELLTESFIDWMAEDVSTEKTTSENSSSMDNSLHPQISTVDTETAPRDVSPEQIDSTLLDEDRRRSLSNRRVGKLAQVLAKGLHQPVEWQEQIREAARVHNIGKLWIPNEILNKPGPLTDEEFDIVKEHTVIGASVLSKRTSSQMQMAARIARSHHERWDGTGYPDGLEEEEIPLSARVVAVADAFDAMTQDRPYRDAYSVDHAIEVISEEAGAQFDPRISDVAVVWREALATLV